MDEPITPRTDPETLTTLTLTTRERAVVARGLACLPAIAALAGQELTDVETRELMRLWARVAPEVVA